MNKVIGIIIAVMVIVLAIVGFVFINSSGQGKTRTTNDKAETDEEGRYLTIINETGEIINEVRIQVGEGTEIESMYQKNPDEKSFSIEIPEEYEEYNKFTIIVIDRYELKYKKTVKEVKEKGRTEVKITKDNYVKQKGDWKKKWIEWFNEL